MYSKIVNPKTGRKVSVKSRLGKNILRKYLFILNGGAANERPLNEPPSVRGAAEGAPTAEVEAFRRHHYSPPVRHSRWSQPRRPQAIDETVRLDASTQGSAEEPPGEDGTAGCAYFPAATMLNPLCMCYKCSARRWAARCSLRAATTARRCWRRWSGWTRPGHAGCLSRRCSRRAATLRSRWLSQTRISRETGSDRSAHLSQPAYLSR